MKIDYADVAQLVDLPAKNAEIAQLVEHIHGKDGVTGSTPVLGSMHSAGQLSAKGGQAW